MSLSAFITVLFLSGVMLLGILLFSQKFIAFQADSISEHIRQEINSGDAIKTLGISSIEKVHKNSPKTKKWIEGLDKNSIIHELTPAGSNANRIYIRIEVNDILICSNVDDDGDIEKFSHFFKDNLAIKPILDSHGNQIGNITVLCFYLSWLIILLFSLTMN